MNEFSPYDPNGLNELLCDIPFYCELQLDLFTDANVDADNPEAVPIYYGHYPAGSSTLNAQFFFSQMPNYPEKKLQRFDYGKAENLRIYKQPEPPVFDLKKIRGPIALFYGGSDRFAPVVNVEWIVDTLTEGTIVEQFFYEEFGHNSWFLSRDMSFVTQDLIPLIKTYSKVKSSYQEIQFLQLN